MSAFAHSPEQAAAVGAIGAFLAKGGWEHRVASAKRMAKALASCTVEAGTVTAIRGRDLFSYKMGHGIVVRAGGWSWFLDGDKAVRLPTWRVEVGHMAKEKAATRKRVADLRRHVERGITFGSFHIATTANFTGCETPDEPADFVSESGSKYWHRNGGVIRRSDHWGSVASCIWGFEGAPVGAWEGRWLSGFCKFSDFKSRRFD